MENELQEMAIAALERDPTRDAIEFEERWISGGELKSLSNAIHRLLDASGIAPDAPVALLARNRPSAITAFISLLAKGCNVQMIYTFQSPAGIARDIARIGPAALVAETEDYSEEVRAELGKAGIAAIALDGMSARAVPPFEKAGNAAERRGPERRQIEIFTSGTTGPPKQFPLDQQMVAQHIVAGSRTFQMGDEAAAEAIPFLIFFPVGNISGIYATLPGMLKGQRAIVLDRFSIEAWRQYILKYRPVSAGIPPSYFQVLLDADLPAEDLASIKMMGAGAAPVDPEVQRDFEDKYGIPILLSYGATEFGGPVTAMTPEDHARHGRAKLGTVGKPIPGARLRVVDPESGEELPAGKEGLLEVISPRMEPEWIRTSDLGMIDEDGFVFHRGRADGAIMRGGFKVLPETIEAALKKHPMVSEAMVVGVSDRRLGQVPAAAIRLTPGASGIGEPELEAHLREHVMKTHLPAKWLFCEELPRTISAKLDRNAVKKLFTGEQAA